MRIRTRLIAATMTGLMLTSAVGAATASAAPASPTKPAPGDGHEKPDHATIAKVAASLGVSVQQLTTALTTLKQALAKGTDRTAAVAAFARELKVSVAAAEKALQQLAGDKKPDKPGVPEEAVKLLAAKLHISTDRARQVFKDLDKVTGRGEAILKDPAFVAIAKGLGITPQRLLDVLVKVKQEISKDEDKPKGKAPSESPAT
jgi:hypothetical protein